MPLRRSTVPLYHPSPERCQRIKNPSPSSVLAQYRFQAHLKPDSFDLPARRGDSSFNCSAIGETADSPREMPNRFGRCGSPKDKKDGVNQRKTPLKDIPTKSDRPIHQVCDMETMSMFIRDDRTPTRGHPSSLALVNIRKTREHGVKAWRHPRSQSTFFRTTRVKIVYNHFFSLFLRFIAVSMFGILPPEPPWRPTATPPLYHLHRNCQYLLTIRQNQENTGKPPKDRWLATTDPPYASIAKTVPAFPFPVRYASMKTWDRLARTLLKNPARYAIPSLYRLMEGLECHAG